MTSHQSLLARTFFLLAGALASCDGTSTPPDVGSVTARPNFVFVLVDDLGWADVGVYGSSFYETPNVDRLAAQGARFTNAYAAGPVCSPTRGSILTGRYPARTDTTNWFGGNVAGKLLPAPYLDYLPLKEVTIAERLQDAGYATGFFGKWHLGGEGYYPENQGFDVNVAGYEAGMPFAGYFSPYGNPKLQDGPEGEHLTARLADESIRFLEQYRDVPFLLYLSFYTVHTPLQAPEEMANKYEQKWAATDLKGPIFGEEPPRRVRLVQQHAVYAGMVESMDSSVGRVLDAIEELGLARNTVVVFMSDNGGLSTSEGHPTSNLPLRAGKGWLYEGGIREPMIIKWPEHTAPGSVIDDPVISTDFYPTMLQMAGLPLDSAQHVDGISLVPVLERTGTLERDALYWHYPHYGNQGGFPGSAVRMGRYKLIESFEHERLQLFDLDNDVSEQNDLVDEMPGRVREMHERLERWRSEVDAKLPTPNPRFGRDSSRP
jgi:arylsulfatase A-like enzyme